MYRYICLLENYPLGAVHKLLHLFLEIFDPPCHPRSLFDDPPIKMTSLFDDPLHHLKSPFGEPPPPSMWVT